MYRRRLIIGAIIGVFTFTILTWIDNQTWQSLEAQVLNGRSYFNFLNPLNHLQSNTVFLVFDKKAKRLLVDSSQENKADEEATETDELNEASSDETNKKPISLNSVYGKDFLLGIIRDFDKYEAKSLAVTISYLDKEVTDELEIEAELGDLRTPISIASISNTAHERINQQVHYVKSQYGFAYDLYAKIDHEKKKLRAKDQKLWINKGKANFKQSYSLADLLTEQISIDKFKGKNIFLVSDFDSKEFINTELNIFGNYLANNWLNYIPLHPLMIFMSIIPLALLFVMLVHWARVFVFLAFAFATLILGQLLFSVFGLYIETLPIISGMMLIFLLSSIVDMNLMAAYLKERLRSESIGSIIIDKKNLSKAPVKNSTNINSANPFMPIKAQREVKEEQASKKDINPAKLEDYKLNNLDIKHIKRKFYTEQEDNLEAVALEFQEKTVKSLLNLQEKIDELRDSHELSHRDKLNVDIIKYDFGQTINELDHLLFSLIPFHFEAEKGLLNSLEILAEKINYLTKGKIRINVGTELDTIKLDPDIKINTYRVIQRVIEVISKRSKGVSSISIDISDSLIFRINYDGEAIDPDAVDFRLREAYKRVSTIDAKLSFFNKLETNTLTNKIELDLQAAKITQTTRH